MENNISLKWLVLNLRTWWVFYSFLWSIVTIINTDLSFFHYISVAFYHNSKIVILGLKQTIGIINKSNWKIIYFFANLMFVEQGSVNCEKKETNN